MSILETCKKKGPKPLDPSFEFDLQIGSAR